MVKEINRFIILPGCLQESWRKEISIRGGGASEVVLESRECDHLVSIKRSYSRRFYAIVRKFDKKYFITNIVGILQRPWKTSRKSEIANNCMIMRDHDTLKERKLQ